MQKIKNNNDDGDNIVTDSFFYFLNMIYNINTTKYEEDYTIFHSLLNDGNSTSRFDYFKVLGKSPNKSEVFFQINDTHKTNTISIFDYEFFSKDVDYLEKLYDYYN